MPKISNFPELGKIEINDEEDSSDDDEEPKESKSFWDPGSDFPTPRQDLDNALRVFGAEAILGTPEHPLRYEDDYIPSFTVSLVRQFRIDHGCDLRELTVQGIAKEIKKSLIGYGFNISHDCSDEELAEGLKGLLDFYNIEYKQ